MKLPRAGVLLIVVSAAALPGVATAQSQFPPPPFPSGGGSPTVQDRWPEAAKPAQAEPLQSPAQQAAPKPKSERKPEPKHVRSKAWISDDSDATAAAPAAASQRPAAPRAPAHVVVCNGVFAKNSAHLKLAQRFDSRNVTFGQVDGPDGSRINASILFPNDPKRRLEVVWANEAARADTSVIAINGKSQWIAPKGVKLGLPVAALEKLNGRPFKLSGFGKDGSASVTDWDGGALSSLPGGCKIGMRLMADGKTPDEARDAVAGEKEFHSNDAGVRAVKPTVGEILIGY